MAPAAQRTPAAPGAQDGLCPWTTPGGQRGAGDSVDGERCNRDEGGDPEQPLRATGSENTRNILGLSPTAQQRAHPPPPPASARLMLPKTDPKALSKVVVGPQP